MVSLLPRGGIVKAQSFLKVKAETILAGKWKATKKGPAVSRGPRTSDPRRTRRPDPEGSPGLGDADAEGARLGVEGVPVQARRVIRQVGVGDHLFIRGVLHEGLDGPAVVGVGHRKRQVDVAPGLDLVRNRIVDPGEALGLVSTC